MKAESIRGGTIEGRRGGSRIVLEDKNAECGRSLNSDALPLSIVNAVVAARALGVVFPVSVCERLVGGPLRVGAEEERWEVAPASAGDTELRRK